MIEDGHTNDGKDAAKAPPVQAVETGSAHAPPRFNLVRWIMVVTLGCSLGLLLVLTSAYLRAFQNGDGTMEFVNGRPVRLASFKLTEPTVEKELRQVIESQLSAFREDDYATAYTYAAEVLKERITLPAFERMVKTSYPLIAQSRSAQFGVALDNGEQAVVKVTISGRSGRARHYQYILEREGASWRIIGVSEVRPEGITI